MIPLRDNLPSRSFPFITVIIIALNFYVFYLEITSAGNQLNRLIAAYGLIPAKLVKAVASDTFFPGALLPLISNLFLHGGWLHIIGNMWYLWIFGDNVEDWLGHGKFALFFLVCGIAANVSHILIDPASTIPTIGASGAVSGILGAYLALFPSARIKTLFPVFLFITVIEIPAVLFLGLWFILQMQSGAAALVTAGSNIAWWAHIGGFITGLISVRFFR